MASRAHRLLVAGADLKFARPLIRALEASGQVEVRLDEWLGHNRHDGHKSRAQLAWAETVLCEWCLGNAVWYSHRLRSDQRLLVRFHGQERLTAYPRLTNWENVSRLAFVGPHVLTEALGKFPIPARKARLIPNAVDTALFERPKHPEAFFRLGLLGYCPRLKRLDRALDLLALLKRRDERYTLHVKGHHPTHYRWLWQRAPEREHYTALFERLNRWEHRLSVVFDPPGDDVPEWLTGIGFVLSPSEFESFHLAISEGMASGALPLIWQREGAGEIHGSEHLVEDAGDAAERIERLRVDDSRTRRCEQAQQTVRERFSLERVRDLWLEEILPEGRVSAPEKRKDGRASALEKRPAARALLVVFAIDDWATFHRREMLESLAEHLKDTTDLLIIEPGNHGASLLARAPHLEEELRAYASIRCVRAGENIWKFRSLTRGFGNGLPAPGDLASPRSDRDLLRSRLRALFPGHERVIYWLYKPDLKHRWLATGDEYLYECYDEYTRQFGSGRFSPLVALQEVATLSGARAAFFTSQTLYERKQRWTSRPILAENGVCYARFARHCEDPTTSSRPGAVGYLGNLADFFDWGTMLEVARQMPEVTFWFHGPVHPRAEKTWGDTPARLMALPNCHFTGWLDRDEGARRIAGHGALVIPFVRNPAMDAVNPLKLWEYFSTGLPVICSPISTLTHLAPLLSFASEPDEWVRAIREALCADPPARKADRIRLAQQHDWKQITSVHAQVLREICS